MQAHLSFSCYKGKAGRRGISETCDFCVGLHWFAYIATNTISEQAHQKGFVSGKKGRKPVDELTREQGAAQCFCAAWNLVPLSTC
ncbi:hypothetical protein DWW10_03275 [Bacteroides intestinalis]|uniref:Uncharacterized protein n=1 Tax=Bacteroides intestinalis TaxID=329854 RepID=A0A412YI88_9BACE|nr:hypothetical protein DWW10_03275 [Bacteroides intestinalis]RHA61522.1 hypothetical protein DW932_04740 [Bacteroides intestinalis]